MFATADDGYPLKVGDMIIAANNHSVCGLSLHAAKLYLRVPFVLSLYLYFPSKHEYQKSLTFCDFAESKHGVRADLLSAGRLLEHHLRHAEGGARSGGLLRSGAESL